MRSLLAELAGVLLGSIVLVSIALALLPGGEGTWLDRVLEHLATALSLDFGYSQVSRRPVMDTILDAGATSALIIASTAALLLSVGVPLGVLAAQYPGSRVISSTRRLVDSFSSLPVLVWSTLIFVWAAATLSEPLVGTGRSDRGVSVVSAAVVALLLGDRLLADIVRRVEISTREILAEPYMRTVRAAGFGVRRHLVRSLVPPIADLIVSRSLFLIGGAIVVERVFSLPGLGFTVVDALERAEQDKSLVLAAALALVMIGLWFRVVRYAAVAFADPRARA
jgi:peptide/nickel transport system permease protein